MHRTLMKASTALAIAVLFALSACGSDSSDPSSKASSSVPSDQQDAAKKDGTAAGVKASSGKKVAAPKKTIAFLNYTSQAAALRRVESGMKAAAKAAGWEFVSCDAQGDPQKVGSCGASFIQSKVDVIASVAIPQASMSANMRKAKDAGIPWISSGGQIPDNEDLFAGSFYFPESKLYGPLDETFFKELGSGDVQIAALQLTVDSTARARQEQLDADLKNHKNVSVPVRIEGSPSDPAAATAATVAALQQHPDIKGIWSCCDILNQPIVQAVAEAGRAGSDAPIVVGAFPDENMLAAIRGGKMFAAMELPWEAYGWMAVDQSLDHFARDAEFTQHGEPDQYPAALYSGFLVTKDNVQQEDDELQQPEYDYATYFDAKWAAEFEPMS